MQVGCHRQSKWQVTLYLLILVAAFIGIVIWEFSRKRKARFEASARIPLDDDNADQS